MSKRIKPYDSPVEAKVENGVLHITVGVGALANIVRFSGDDYTAKVVNAQQFAEEVVDQIRNHDDEEGTTPIHRALDEIADAIFESGSECVEEIEEDEDEE